MKDTLLDIIDFLLKQKIDYADLRWVKRCKEDIRVKNRTVENVSHREDAGVGIRVMTRGAWGFAATSEPDAESLRSTAQKTIELARASAETTRVHARLDDSEPHVGSYQSPCERDPFEVPLDVKTSLLLSAADVILQNKKIVTAHGSMEFLKTSKLFLSTEGAEIEQTLLFSGAGISAEAQEDGQVQRRSFPTSFDGDFAARGYEHVEGLGLVENAARVRDEAVALLTAPECPAGRQTLIIGGSQLALQIHESCGHPIELDRALGAELGFMGGSFLRPEGLGSFRYGSEHVNIVADSTIAGAMGSFGFDDEGVAAQRSQIVLRGAHVGYLTSRDTAPTIGRQSNGSMRADGWNRLPLIRMTNVNLEPSGKGTLSELIADTKKGILLETNKSWSIDQQRLNFQFGTEVAREIENGKLGRLLRNPVYTGLTPEFWGSCVAVCGPEEWRVWGIPNCGKGQPMQRAYVGHGTAPAKFVNVEVGVAR